jgi:hypothetical protein
VEVVYNPRVGEPNVFSLAAGSRGFKMSAMAKEPKKVAPKPQAAPVSAGSTNPISYKPSKAVAAGMAEYLGRADVAPSKSAVIERALREFFKARGIEVSGVADE